MDLLKANFRFAAGHLMKNKYYTLLNIIGLSVGMTCSFLILLWVYNEIKIDSFHQNKENLYEVLLYEKKFDGTSHITSSLSAPLAPALLEEIPEIKAVTRMPWPQRQLVKYGNKAFFEKEAYADTSFFEMFSFHLLKGNPSICLKNPGSIVISRKMANKYFENEEPLGKTLTVKLNTDRTFIVTGVFDDIPANSSLEFDFVLPFQLRLQDQPWTNSWGELSLLIFIQTQPNVTAEIISRKIRDIYKKHHPTMNAELFAVQFSKRDLYPIEYKDANVGGKLGLIITLSLMAIIILIIACVNYINMATALASTRSREVGIKKVLGSSRQSLILQYLSESAIVAFIGVLIMIMLIELIIPGFNIFFSSHIALKYSDPVIVLMIIICWIFTSFFSGFYPAFAISSANPVLVLKSKLTTQSSKWQREALVVFQFTITIALIICMFFFNQQIRYIQNKNLGVDKENILFFNYYNGILKHKESFKEEILAQPVVESVCFTSMNPINITNTTSDPKWEGKDADDDRSFSVLFTDFDFVKTFGATVIEGRDFSNTFPTDSVNFLINEKCRKAMGLSEPIGKKLSLLGKEGIIIGIVKDFNVNHLAAPIAPLIIEIYPEMTSHIFVKIKPGHTTEAIKNIGQIFVKYEQDYPFEYTFQTDFFNSVYKNNLILIGKMSSVFSLLAIVISCLGLFGLTAFMAEQRTKEIGVRKVNGATLTNVLRLLIYDILKWVAIAYLAGVGISWFVAYKYIKSFAFCSDINIWIFINAGITAFTIAIITVSWQSWRAANRNPVDALRYE